MTAWDDDFAQQPVINQHFDDEEDESEDVKDSWEDEDKSQTEEQEATQTQLPSEPQRFAQVSKAKKAGKRMIRIESEKQRQKEVSEPVVPLTYEQKKALEEKQQSSDFDHTEELFSGLQIDDAHPTTTSTEGDPDSAAFFGTGAASTPSNHETDKHDIILLTPTTAEDFAHLAKQLGDKTKPYEDSYLYLDFLKALLKEVTESLAPEEVKDLIATLNVITNQKIKGASLEKGKKKKTTKKKQTTASRNVDVEEDIVEDEYDFLS